MIAEVIGPFHDIAIIFAILSNVTVVNHHAGVLVLATKTQVPTHDPCNEISEMNGVFEIFQLPFAYDSAHMLVVVLNELGNVDSRTERRIILSDLMPMVNGDTMELASRVEVFVKLVEDPLPPEDVRQQLHIIDERAWLQRLLPTGILGFPRQSTSGEDLIQDLVFGRSLRAFEMVVKGIVTYFFSGRKLARDYLEKWLQSISTVFSNGVKHPTFNRILTVQIFGLSLSTVTVLHRGLGVFGKIHTSLFFECIRHIFEVKLFRFISISEWIIILVFVSGIRWWWWRQ
jgi:hypothetical protein